MILGLCSKHPKNTSFFQQIALFGPVFAELPRLTGRGLWKGGNGTSAQIPSRNVTAGTSAAGRVST